MARAAWGSSPGEVKGPTPARNLKTTARTNINRATAMGRKFRTRFLSPLSDQAYGAMRPKKAIKACSSFSDICPAISLRMMVMASKGLMASLYHLFDVMAS